jgi:uncharacterized protein involved in exopolysaccharide biosynthesis
MAQGYELNLRDYWNIVRKRKWIILFFFFTTLAFAVVYTNIQPLLYKTSATIKIEPIVDMARVYTRSWPWPKPELSDYAKQVISFPILKKTLEELGMIDQGLSQQHVNQLIRDVSGNLSTKTMSEANMISIEMVSPDPENSAAIVNKIIEVFKDENIEQKNQQVINARKFIENQLVKISDRLRASEDELKELTLKGVGRLSVSVINKINELESRRADLLTRFTELHPDIIRIDEQLESLEDQLRNLPKEEFEYNVLKRDVVTNESLYASLRQRLQEARIRESEKIDNVILISPAMIPAHPFSPNKPSNYLLGIVLGIVLGMSIGLVFEHLDTSIGRIEDLEAITRLNVIGVIPYFSDKGKDIKRGFLSRKILPRSKNTVTRHERKRDELIISHKESSIFLESFRILGANIQVVLVKAAG